MVEDHIAYDGRIQAVPSEQFRLSPGGDLWGTADGEPEVVISYLHELKKEIACHRNLYFPAGTL